jgi:hypothetical protein
LRFRDYEGGHEINAFFYGGTFHLKRTSFSRPALEQLSEAIEPEQPEPPRKPIGFV